MSKAYIAGGTIRVSRFVKLKSDDNNVVQEADANEKVIGISQEGGRVAPIPTVTADPVEAAQAGEHLNVHLPGGLRKDISLVIGSGGCNAGDRLKSDADGKGVVIASTGTTIQHYGAIAMAAASENELCPVEIVIGSERPALT